jgi:hypothetical protein
MSPLEATQKVMKDWIWSGKHSSTNHFSLSVDGDERQFVRLRFKTSLHSYSIRGYPPSPKDGNTYMCCEYSNRNPLPGETWTRGGDLADGLLNKKTWDRIMADILSVELAAAAEEVTA